MSDRLMREVDSEFHRVKDSGGSVFPEPLVKEWLRRSGIDVPDGSMVGSAREACRFASQAGYPVVLKATSVLALHKTELGGVAVGIGSDREMKRAFAEMMESPAVTEPGFAGLMVEKQAEAGVELIVGVQDDPHFGPVLMVGSGGVLTDILADVRFRALPVSASEIRAMLSKLAVLPLLKGFRGAPPVDMKALVSVVSAIARLAWRMAPYMESADFNPVIARPDGATVVDAKVALKAGTEPVAIEVPRPNISHLSRFFSPASVAVVGASASTGKIGNVIVDSLVKHQFQGRVYPINPNRSEIMGVRCYPSLDRLPETPELVVMVVDLDRGPELMRDLAERGVHNLLIVSGGGKELGGERERIEGEMARLARDLDIRVIGPNCIGAFDGDTRFDSFFHSHDRLLRPPDGSMGFITQSGTWGCAFLEEAEVAGVSKMVSYGNRLDVDEGDLIAFLAADPRTKVIGSYIEGLKDGRKFLAAARSAVVDHGKPVVVYKTGRTERSARAAVSHTGAYGGAYEVYEGVLEQAGVIATDSILELCAACRALARVPAARGPRAAMLSNGAGPMVNAIDVFAERGLELTRLRRESVRSMRDHFSFFYLVENPVDVTGSASAEDYEFVIGTLLADDRVDIIMPYFVFQDTPLDEGIVERMAALARSASKPIVGCAVGGPYTRRMSRALEQVGIPVFPDVAQWTAAASALARWGRVLKEKRAWTN